jgi:hypothetical protein
VREQREGLLNGGTCAEQGALATCLYDAPMTSNVAIGKAQPAAEMPNVCTCRFLDRDGDCNALPPTGRDSLQT